jgi:antitoxin component YwqK of YwqJK toxin-antitoxin module
MQSKIHFLKICCIAAILCLIILPFTIYPQTFSENQIKGALLYKITKFIRWPNDPGKKIKLCFMDELEDQHKETLAKTIANLINPSTDNFELVTTITINDITSCNLLFIGMKSQSKLQDILTRLEGKPTVTISDIIGFTKRGGMFGFYRKNGNIAVELNYTNAKNNGVTINAALRELITVVD